MPYGNAAKTGGLAVPFSTGLDPGYLSVVGVEDAFRTFRMNVPVTLPFLATRVSWDIMPGVSLSRAARESDEPKWSLLRLHHGVHAVAAGGVCGITLDRCTETRIRIASQSQIEEERLKLPPRGWRVGAAPIGQECLLARPTLEPGEPGCGACVGALVRREMRGCFEGDALGVAFEQRHTAALHLDGAVEFGFEHGLGEEAGRRQERREHGYLRGVARDDQAHPEVYAVAPTKCRRQAVRDARLYVTSYQPSTSPADGTWCARDGHASLPQPKDTTRRARRPGQA
jgi:hypothetical protein